MWLSITPNVVLVSRMGEQIAQRKGPAVLQDNRPLQTTELAEAGFVNHFSKTYHRRPQHVGVINQAVWSAHAR